MPFTPAESKYGRFVQCNDTHRKNNPGVSVCVNKLVKNHREARKVMLFGLLSPVLSVFIPGIWHGNKDLLRIIGKVDTATDY